MICLWHRQKLCGWEAALRLYVLGRGPEQWVSFLDQPTYPNVLQRHWQMGHENTNSVPRGGHEAKCYTGLSMLRWARKKLSTTQNLTTEKFLQSFLVSVSCGMFLNRTFQLLCLRLGLFPHYPNVSLPTLYGPDCLPWSLKEVALGELNFLEPHLPAGLWASDMTEMQFCPRGLPNQEDTDAWAPERLYTLTQGPSTRRRDQLSLVGWCGKLSEANGGGDFWTESGRVNRLMYIKV